MKKILSVFAVLAVLVYVSVHFFPVESVDAQGGYNTNCYMEQGGSKFVAGSGCEIEVQSGAIFDIQDGSTVSGISTTSLSSLTVSGASTLSGTVVASDTASFNGAVTFGTDGTAADVTFYSDTTGDLMLWDQSEEALTITGTNGQDALNVDDGNVDIADNIDVAGFYISTSQSITPTDGAVITPTSSLVILTPAGEVTPTISACAGGEQLILYNSVNQTINLADSGNFVLASALTLGQYDVLRLACIDSKWVQVSAVSAN
jgi:hypothetical protein